MVEHRHFARLQNPGARAVGWQESRDTACTWPQAPGPCVGLGPHCFLGRSSHGQKAPDTNDFPYTLAAVEGSEGISELAHF